MRRLGAVLVILGFTLLPSSSASAADANLCDRTVAAVGAVAANGTIADVRRAVQRLKDVGKDATAQAQCGEDLSRSPTRAASDRALALGDTAPDYDGAAALTAALVLDPTNPVAQALLAASQAVPCEQAQRFILEGKDDQAKALIDDLVATGDDDAVKCAKALKVQLANDASAPVSHLSRLTSYGKDRLLGPVTWTVVGVFALLLLFRLLRAAAPMRPWEYKVHRAVGPHLVWAAAALGFFAVGALVGDISETVTDKRRWNLLDGHVKVAFLAGVVALVLVIGAELSRRWLRDWRRWPAIRVGMVLLALGLATVVGLYTQYREAEWPRLLYLIPAAVAALLIGLWASGQVRLTIKDFEAEQVTKGLPAAIGAAFDALAARPANSIYLATNAPEKPPELSFANLPGNVVLTFLLSIWRAITPSSDLTLKGAAMTESDKAVRLSLSLSRGTRAYRSTTISSRIFWVADKGDDDEQSSMWNDLSVAVAAWLLLQTIEITGQDRKGLNGATRWESIALLRVASQRSSAAKLDAARALVTVACNVDPGNRAAEYSRLSFRGADLDADADPAEYLALADAIWKLGEKS